MLSSASPKAFGKGPEVKTPGSVFPWLPLGYCLIAALLVFRVAYIASDTIELSKDEAYQWLWSKHLALSYYSKPPGIALIQFAGTSIWGDRQLGVRFFSPVCAAILSFVMLRFMAREAGPRQAFLLLLILSCVPLMGIGTILMTIDPPLVLFWMLSLIAGWRGVQPDGKTIHWLLAGLAGGLGFLCKYNALYLIVCWALFLALWKPGRAHLRKPGPYLAILVIALCAIPVVIWNAQHGWITAHHVADNAALRKEWKPTLRFFAEFTGAEFTLLNPVFFVGMIWAAIGFWRKRQENPLALFFFCMGAPVFLGHWLYSLHSRVQPNWVAPSVVPLSALMLLYWDSRWCDGVRAAKPWFITGVTFGILMMAPMHDSSLIGKLAGHPWPVELDPLRRVRAWKETSSAVESARQKLLLEGKPAFTITDHYGTAGEFSFYTPAARETLKKQPLVYSVSSAEPRNQLYFWSEYRYTETRKGQNAIYVAELDPYTLEKGWLWKWLNGKEPAYGLQPPPPNAPAQICEQFESVNDLGICEVRRGDRIFRRVRLFECRNLRAQ
jgi:hypothetical protein